MLRIPDYGVFNPTWDISINSPPPTPARGNIKEDGQKERKSQKMCKSVGKHQMPWSQLWLLAKDWANHHFILHREGIQSILQYPLRDFGQLMVTSPSAPLQWKRHGEVASVLGNSSQVMLTQVTAAKLSGGGRLEVGAREGERQG